MEIDFAIDGDAYATLSPVVLSRETVRAAGVFRSRGIWTQVWISLGLVLACQGGLMTVF